MFNLSGSEIVIILLLALIVLGPEKLPDAIRRAGRVYAELREMSRGFKNEVRSAFEEPMRELRATAEMTRRAINDPLREEPWQAEQVAPQALVDREPAAECGQLDRPSEREPHSGTETQRDEADPA